jgi:hypothetical protein
VRGNSFSEQFIFYVGEIDITTFFKVVGAWCIYWFHINTGLMNVVKSYVAIVLEKKIKPERRGPILSTRFIGVHVSTYNGMNPRSLRAQTNLRVSVKDYVPDQLVARKGAPSGRLSQFWPSANGTHLVHSATY